MTKIQTSENPTWIASDSAWAGTAQELEAPVWINLTTADSSSLQALQTQYALPSELVNYFPHHYQWAELIHAGSALFLVTFLTAPSERSLFTPHELKIYVTPTRIVTVYTNSRQLQPTLPVSPDQATGGIGMVLYEVLAASIQSYESIVQVVQQRWSNKQAQVDPEQWDKRTRKFLSFLRAEHRFLQHLAQESGQLCTQAERSQLQSLAERVQGFARATWEAKEGGHRV